MHRAIQRIPGGRGRHASCQHRVQRAAIGGTGNGRTARIDAPSPVERGNYLVNTIMACGNCHTPRDAGGKPVTERAFSGGGLTFTTPAFVATAPNITPDVETGIGGWSDAEIKRALVTGMRPDHGHLAGVALAAVMPANFYKALLPEDLDADRRLSPHHQADPQSRCRSPSTKPRCIATPIPTPRPDLTRPCLPTPQSAAPISSPSAIAWNAIRHFHAAYRISGPAWAAAAGCSRHAKGSRPGRPASPPTSPRILSPASAAGPIRKSSRAITQGVARDGRTLKQPMAYGYYASLKPSDLADIIAYLRTVPPLQ